METLARAVNTLVIWACIGMALMIPVAGAVAGALATIPYALWTHDFGSLAAGAGIGAAITSALAVIALVWGVIENARR